MAREIRLTPTQAEIVQEYLAQQALLEGDRLCITAECEARVLQQMDEALARLEANDSTFSDAADGRGFSRYWAARRLREAVGRWMSWRTTQMEGALH